MAIIIDRRDTKTDKNTSNRERFLKRYRKYLKGRLDKVVGDSNIEDLTGSVDVHIDWDLEELDVGFDHDSGDHDFVLPGNKEYLKGDVIYQDEEDSDENGTGSGGEGKDNYSFSLTKEEFFDIYFHDMELPDFVKESMLDTTKLVHRRAGFTKDGIPARLDVLKTLQMAIARRISAKGSEKKPPYLDDCDLRYKNYINKHQPMLKAVMFCVMDVSGSMEKFHKVLAKKFFIFLFLFLNKNYDSVELRFIRYHHQAIDCTEREFFYSRDTGGTEVLQAYELIGEIIEKEYPSQIYNIYIAHATDGDTGGNDTPKAILSHLDQVIIPKVQYYAYLQVMSERQASRFYEGWEKLYGILKSSISFMKKVNLAVATDANEIFNVLHNLFKKGR